MNKTKLISPVAEAAGITHAQAKAAIDAVFNTLVDAINQGESATLLGFGSFVVVERPERQACAHGQDDLPHQSQDGRENYASCQEGREV